MLDASSSLAIDSYFTTETLRALRNTKILLAMKIIYYWILNHLLSVSWCS